MAETTVKLHAKASPSGSHRWALCHAAPGREAVLPYRPAGAAADGGTVLHDLGEGGLRHGDLYVASKRGSRALVDSRGQVTYVPADSPAYSGGHMVDDEVEELALRYVNHIRGIALAGELLIEERLSIEHLTGEAGAHCTSDAIVLMSDEIYVGDLKGGFIRVSASYPLEGVYLDVAPDSIKALAKTREVRFPNPQALMYAEAARHAHDPAGTRFKRVRLSIIQPRLNHVDEHVIELEEFKLWVEWIGQQARATRAPSPRVVPSSSTCQWCRAFPCKEATELALKTALDDFEDKPRDPAAVDIAQVKKLVPLIRQFCDAIESRVHEELSAGRPVSGFKLVEGDLGDRKWASDEDVRAAFVSIGLKPEQYLNSKTISPAQTEKLVIGKRASPTRVIPSEQWEALQSLIAPRAIGAPKVVPDSDSRPPLVIDRAADFDDDMSDFFN